LHDAQFNAPLQEIIEGFSRAITNPDSPEMHQIEEAVRANLENSITDPVLREKLRPHYRAACKRLIFSADFYQAIQRPNVSVVTEGIERIEPRGVRTSDGQLHEFDVLVLATGFKADQFMRPMNVIGRNGTLLNDVWKKRPSAYMAISIPDFPNLFMLNGPNGPVGNFSLIEIAEQQWSYISQLFELLRNNTYREISAKHDALAAFDRDRIAAAKTTIFGSGCNSWYLDAEGVPATWPWTRARFAQEMLTPKFDAFELVS
jgi:cation diffusion facilitator CzcD-associated flavoprotein CzcO